MNIKSMSTLEKFKKELSFKNYSKNTIKILSQYVFNKVFKYLVLKRKISISSEKESFIVKGIGYTEFKESLFRLVVLGFATKNKYLDGTESFELTRYGEEMFKAINFK